jgi:hypothetical protein
LVCSAASLRICVRSSGYPCENSGAVNKFALRFTAHLTKGRVRVVSLPLLPGLGV